MGARERVESFHLLFLRALTSQLADRTLVAVKGGCNLRFFFASPRFSEDMDLDVHTVAKGTLEKKVRGILESAAFARLLAAHRLRIESWSAPKQTETVQRWKVAVTEPAGGIPEPTKIEFSRRGSGATEVQPVPSAFLERLGIPGPILAAHYDADAAAAQKLEALIGRTTPQARDVFDLHWLVARGASLPASLDDRTRQKATDRLMGFTRDDFESHVVAYLEADEQPHWGDPAVLEAMQLRLAEALAP